MVKNKPTNHKVDFERISILYANTNVGYFGITAGIIFFGFIISQLVDAQTALFWMAIVSITYIPRAALSIMFSRKMKTGEINYENVNSWERYFFYNSILPFLCFSSAVFIPYEQNEFIALLFYTVIIMTLISGSILSYSTSLPVIY